MTPTDVTAWIADLWRDGDGLAPETIRKTKSTLAQLFDFAEVSPNPVRHKSVKVPRRDVEIPDPPIASHVTATFHLLPVVYRLPTLVLDMTGERISEFESMRWGDVAEPDGSWRVFGKRVRGRKQRVRWVPVADFPGEHPMSVFSAVMTLLAREDRDPNLQVFAGFDGDAYRTALGRACRAAGVPVFSPHDLRHRRATLWHLQGVPVALAAHWLGHSVREYTERYTHVTISDRSDIDHEELLGRVRTALPLVLPRYA